MKSTGIVRGIDSLGRIVLPKELRAAFKEAGISIDPMSTGAAVRTYNIMLSESRAVAAALIAVEG